MQKQIMTASSHFQSAEEKSCHKLPSNKSQSMFRTRKTEMSRSSSNNDLLRETLKAGRRTNGVLKDLSDQENILARRP